MSIVAPGKTGGQLYANLNYFPTSGTSLILHGERRNLISKPSVLMTTFRIAEDYAASVKYNYRLGPQKDFIFLSDMQVEKYEQYSYEGSDLREDYRAIDYGFHLGFASEPNNDFWMGTRLGINVNHAKPNGIEALGLMSYDRFNSFVELFAELNNLDAPAFATSGWMLSMSLSHLNELKTTIRGGSSIREYIPTDQGYWKGEFTIHRSQSLLEGLVVEPHIKGGWKSEASFVDNYRMGGLEDRSVESLALLGLNTDQIHMTQFINMGGELRLRVLGNIFAAIKVDYLSGELAFQQKSITNIGEQISFWSYGLVGSLQSPLGPIKLGYGYNTYTNEWNTNLTVGYSFF